MDHRIALSCVMAGVLGCACHVDSAAVTDGVPRVPGQLGPDGALRFASADEFFSAFETVDRLPAAELDAWERDLGFVSMRRAFRELELRLASAHAEQWPGLLAANADLLDPASPEPARKVRNGYAALIDRRGIMHVDGVVHKVTATNVFTSRDGDAATIDARFGKTPGLLPTLSSVDGVESFRYVDLNAAGGCGASRSGTTTTSDRRETYEARALLVKVTTAIGDRQYRYRNELELRGFKKNFFGNWVSYNTTFQTYYNGVSMDAFRVLGFDGVRHQYDYVTLDLRFPDAVTPEASGVTFFTFLGDTVQNVDEAPLQPAALNKVHHETTSRGTFPIRGVLSCGYCSDGTCQADVHETEPSCASDCSVCNSGYCSSRERFEGSCYADCHCGDGVCDDIIESSSTCPADCGLTPCFIEPCSSD